ncbi:hypothetical protein BC830DRAFT_1174351 [Chytriomyces sp. MP71]|nr:hypothetical protein BC830DRAFT_1174351 [Chytriomyces sp. MP71]
MSRPTLESLAATTSSHELFAIFCYPLASFQGPDTPGGRDAFHAHFIYLDKLRTAGKLVFAGPINLPVPGQPPVHTPGALEGMIIIRAADKKEAEKIAFEDPYHAHGQRRNDVHTWLLAWSHNELTPKLAATFSKI